MSIRKNTPPTASDLLKTYSIDSSDLLCDIKVKKSDRLKVHRERLKKLWY